MTKQEFHDIELIEKISVLREYQGPEAAAEYIYGNEELLCALHRKNVRLFEEIQNNDKLIKIIEGTLGLVRKKKDTHD
jgi:hypothetical protein